MAFIKFRPLTPTMNFKEIIDAKNVGEDILKLVKKDEEIFCVLRAVRDIGILTNRRIIIVDKKGIRGFRQKIYSIMYSCISNYNIEIKNMDTIIEITLDSGYQVVLSFYKPIPLEDMFKIYNFIDNKILENN